MHRFRSLQLENLEDRVTPTTIRPVAPIITPPTHTVTMIKAPSVQNFAPMIGVPIGGTPTGGSGSTGGTGGGVPIVPPTGNPSGPGSM